MNWKYLWSKEIIIVKNFLTTYKIKDTVRDFKGLARFYSQEQYLAAYSCSIIIHWINWWTKSSIMKLLRPPGALNSETNITEYSGIIGRRDINAMIIWHWKTHSFIPSVSVTLSQKISMTQNSYWNATGRVLHCSYIHVSLYIIYFTYGRGNIQ